MRNIILVPLVGYAIYLGLMGDKGGTSFHLKSVDTGEIVNLDEKDGTLDDLYTINIDKFVCPSDSVNIDSPEIRNMIENLVADETTKYDSDECHDVIITSPKSDIMIKINSTKRTATLST